MLDQRSALRVFRSYLGQRLVYITLVINGGPFANLLSAVVICGDRRAMRSRLLSFLLVILAVAHGSSTPTALPTNHLASALPTNHLASALPTALSTGNPTSQPSINPTRNNDDTDDDKMSRVNSHGPFQSAKKAISTLLLIPSITAGLMLSAFLSRLIWRKKSTAFDSLVLAMTLWQLLLDLMLLLDPNFVSFNLPKAFCGSHCRNRVMAYKSGDDGYFPRTDDDLSFGRYDEFDIELQVFYFFKQISYIASALESTIIVLTTVRIVFYQVRPQVVLTHFFVIQLAVFLLSLIFPLVYLLWWFDTIPGRPPFNLKGTRDASVSSQRFAGSIDAAIYSAVLASILINVISCAAIYWQTAARRSASVKGGVLLELSKRLALYPFVQFSTRIFDVVYYITWWDSPLYPYSNVKRRGGNGKEVSDGWGHLLATTSYMSVDFLHAILLSPSGLILAFVYFRFTPRAWERVKKILEKHLYRNQGSDSVLARSSRASPPSHKDHIPTEVGAEVGEQYSSGTESWAEKCLTTKDLDDDELLVILESKEGVGGRVTVAGEISAEMSGLYRDGHKNINLRAGDNPLHRLKLAPHDHAGATL